MESIKKAIRENPVVSVLGAAAMGAGAFHLYQQNNQVAAPAPKKHVAVPLSVVPRSTKLLQGKVALITGSSSGIGRAVAVAYAEEGATVVVNYPTGNANQKALADEVVNAITAAGETAVVIAADVSDETEVNAMVQATLQKFGVIDILVNNAGMATSAAVHEMPVEMWDKLIAVNLRSVFLCTKAVLSHMYGRCGSGENMKIINTASQLAYKGAPGFCHYTASKGAMLSFTRSVALEIGSKNININSVGPGATMTPILADVPAAILDAIRAAIPRGQLGEVDDITPVYVFLASQKSNHFVGQCLSPNGGDAFL